MSSSNSSRYVVCFSSLEREKKGGGLFLLTHCRALGRVIERMSFLNVGSGTRHRRTGGRTDGWTSKRQVLVIYTKEETLSRPPLLQPPLRQFLKCFIQENKEINKNDAEFFIFFSVS